ncbi:MAG: ChaN family lipoprotein [Pseudohongiella sp.]|nr:ChaN family lipoprotein [Pseudohongiella sp.]
MKLPIVCTLLLTLSGTSLVLHASDGSAPWQSDLHADHALVGQIWDTQAQRFVSQDALLEKLANSHTLLLGEKHDNPDHHRLRLSLLERLLDTGQPALLAMEMLTESQQTAINALSASQPLPGSETWQSMLTWDDGWTWEFYEPALRAGLTTGSRIVAGNISSDTMMQVYRADTSEAIAAPALLNTTQLQRLTEEIDVSHCGMLPAAQIPPMVRVQQARDQHMANALTTPGDFSRRILLAGNFHIRHDLSVPNYLPEEFDRPLALAFLEVDPAALQASDYLSDAAGDRVYDFIWFTPAIRGDDYCADLEQ